MSAPARTPRPDRDAAPPFLPSDPPPLAVRGLSYTLIIAFFAAILIASVIELPVTVTGRFTLVPVRGADPLRSPRAGIVAGVDAIEGQAVKKGASLFFIRSEMAGDRAGEEAELEIRIRGVEDRLANARRRHESQVKADAEEERSLQRRAASLGREIELSRGRLELSKKLADQAQKLYDEKLGSVDQLLARQIDVSRAEVDIASLEGNVDQARSSLAKLQREMEVRERELDELSSDQGEELRRAKVRLATLREGPVRADGDKMALLAPCDGSVLRLYVKAAGAVVSEGEIVCEIACAGEALQAEVIAPDNGFGLMKIGQPIKLFYDAFPYERHGVRYGTVRWLGPTGALSSASGAAGARDGAAGARGDAPAFRVLADLKDASFRVGGEPYPLVPGMGGRAEVIVERRTPLSYLFSPLRELRETMASEPSADESERAPGSP